MSKNKENLGAVVSRFLSEIVVLVRIKKFEFESQLPFEGRIMLNKTDQRIKMLESRKLNVRSEHLFSYP